ncbi:MAG: hypothetical protein JWP58_679, partial [Hymenobacter sp.]|nr:hypothetical protein [Hymenobacter sp.]
MKKTLAQKSLELLPDFFANIKDWSKEYFDKHAQDLLDNSSGTVGLVIKTVGKSFIDNYFESISKQKLENYGLSTYVKAAYNQAISSVSTIESSLESKATIQEVSNSLEEVMAGQLSRFDINDTFLVFQPKYHPGVIYVKLNFINLLNNLKIEQLSVVNFIKDFNENIETQVKKEFGDDYEAHIAETVSSFTHKHESDFLLHMISMGKIGFGEGENLKYETTYGKWKDVHKLHKDEKNQLFHTNTPDREAKEYQAKEAELRPVTDLIDDYFNESSCEHIEKILFIVADFGKG